MKNLCLVSLVWFVALVSNAQRIEFDGSHLMWLSDSGTVIIEEPVCITMQKEHQEILRDLLQVSKIDINKDTMSMYRVRGLNRFNKWQLYAVGSDEPLFNEKVRKKYSFDFPSPELAPTGYCFGSFKKTKHLFNAVDLYNEPIARDIKLNPNLESSYYHMLQSMKGQWVLMNELGFPKIEKFIGKYSFQSFLYK